MIGPAVAMERTFSIATPQGYRIEVPAGFAAEELKHAVAVTDFVAGRGNNCAVCRCIRILASAAAAPARSVLDERISIASISWDFVAVGVIAALCTANVNNRRDEIVVDVR